MQTTETKSRSTKQKWLIGCGIGCGVIILIAAILGIGGFLFVKNVVDEFKDMDAITDTLTERYGRMKEYSPDSDGVIEAERLEAFLAAREAYGAIRVELESTFLTLMKRRKDRVEVRRPKNLFQMLKLGLGVIPQIGEFYKTRNQALLDAEIGLGEYYYIYVIVYFSWLGKQPEDGPDFKLMGDDEGDWWDEDEEEALESRRDRTRRRIHRLFLPMLRNQLEKLSEKEKGEEVDEWRGALEDEIEALESDRYRLPWEDGVPEVIESSLRPFRSRLEASYSAIINPLEVAFEQR